MGKFEKQEMEKIRPIKKTWYNWLIKSWLVPWLSAMGEKPKIIGDELKDEIINDIWTLFETQEEKEEKKRSIMKE